MKPAPNDTAPPQEEAPGRPNATARIAEASRLAPASRARYLAFVGLAIIVQLNWGLYGVSTRYLQVHATSTIPSLQLCVVMTAVAWAGLVVFYTIPSAARDCWAAAAARRRARGRALPPACGAGPRGRGRAPACQDEWDDAGDDDELEPLEELPPVAGTYSDCASFVVAVPSRAARHRPPGAAGSKRFDSYGGAAGRRWEDGASFAALMLPLPVLLAGRARRLPGEEPDPSRASRGAAAPTAAGAGAIEECDEDVEAAAGAAGAAAPPAVAAAAAAAAAAARRRWLVSASVAAGIGVLVALQGLTLIYSSRLMYAYLVQLVFLLTPLVTAVANRFLLCQRTPRALWPALAAALAGSALVIVGNWSAHHEAAVGWSARDTAAGFALAFVSMLLLAAYLVLLQVTQHMVTGVQVMWGNTYVGLVLLTPLALAVEGTDWSWVVEMTAADWGVLIFAGFFIDAVNTIWTQHCSRVLGAAVVSLFICCRLASSLAGSAVLLHEAPKSPMTFAGLALVAVALTSFMALKFFDKPDAAGVVAAAGSGGAEGAAEGGAADAGGSGVAGAEGLGAADRKDAGAGHERAAPAGAGDAGADAAKRGAAPGTEAA